MRKKSNKEYALSLKGTYDAPVYFKSLSAFEGAEDSYQSIFQYLQDRERIRPSEEDILGKYRTLLATIYDILGDPLPPDTWSEGEYYTGDDFWGDVQVPFAGATDEQAPNPQVN